VGCFEVEWVISGAGGVFPMWWTHSRAGGLFRGWAGHFRMNHLVGAKVSDSRARMKNYNHNYLASKHADVAVT
jgi:hypothetical protein